MFNILAEPNETMLWQNEHAFPQIQPENTSLNFSWDTASDFPYYAGCPYQESVSSVNYSSMVLEFAKILYGIVFVVGLFGNSLVIYVVLRFSKMRTITNIYLVSLGKVISDLKSLIINNITLYTATKGGKKWVKRFSH